MTNPALDAAAISRAVVDASPDALVGIDADRRIVSWNPAAQKMFGYRESDILGRDCAELVAVRWRRRHPIPERCADLHEALGPFDLLCVDRGGKPFRATLSASPVAGDASRWIALALTLRRADSCWRRDRQALRAARRQADASNRLKNEMLATVSHELRTPLNVIYGWIEVLRTSEEPELRRQAIGAIERIARSMTRMVGDVLDASSLATGKLRLDTKPVDLVRVVAEVVGIFRTPASLAGIALELDCSLPVCVVSGDGERIRQILSNLLSNALKFTPSDGRVRVGLARAGAQAELTVTDSGQGIAPDLVAHVFDAFRRADDEPASPRRGLGLGLSIVRHIVELHGGTVGVESAGSNCGATFTVQLPMADDH